MLVRPATEDDLPQVLAIHRAAFGQDDEADLVTALLAEPSARPMVSLVAEEDGRLVGHVLITHARLEPDAADPQGQAPQPPTAALLAPLAVVPAEQRRGVGSGLTRRALDAAAGMGVALVFVLGHPEYYPRCGFRPALPLGLRPPYPLAAMHADAWMVAETSPGAAGAATGRLVPAAAFDDPDLWCETPPVEDEALSPHARANRSSWNGDSVSYQADHAAQLRDSGGMAWGVWQIPEAELQVLGDVRGRDVLEFGCGAAQWSIALAKAGARPVALDLSEVQLDHARALMADAAVRFPLVHASAESVPLPDESFDIVFCDWGALSFTDPYLSVPEAARLLRPEGLLAFSTSTPIAQMCFPDEEADHPEAELAQDYFGMRALPNDGYVDFMLPYGEWIRLFRANGLEIEDLIELRPTEDATSTYVDAAGHAWARRWPYEQIWKVRRRAIRC